jgi:hypothetical protein
MDELAYVLTQARSRSIRCEERPARDREGAKAEGSRSLSTSPEEARHG